MGPHRALNVIEFMSFTAELFNLSYYYGAQPLLAERI